jgi:hypothetical protein
MWGVDPKTVACYERQGFLTPIRLNCRVIRYRREELEAFIARCSGLATGEIV